MPPGSWTCSGEPAAGWNRHRANEQAVAADRRGVVLMVAAETARAYLELRGVQRQLQIDLDDPGAAAADARGHRGQAPQRARVGPGGAAGENRGGGHRGGDPAAPAGDPAVHPRALHAPGAGAHRAERRARAAGAHPRGPRADRGRHPFRPAAPPSGHPGGRATAGGGDGPGGRGDGAVVPSGGPGRRRRACRAETPATCSTATRILRAATTSPARSINWTVFDAGRRKAGDQVRRSAGRCREGGVPGHRPPRVPRSRELAGRR